MMLAANERWHASPQWNCHAINCISLRLACFCGISAIDCNQDLSNMANGHGGKREGSGRKPGSANQKTREIANAAVAQGLTPLEYMLAVLRDESADPERRDRMAAAAAPYIHPRLSNVEAKIDVTGHEAALAEIEEIEATKFVPPRLPVN
jgi:hypothetical protein